MAKYANSFWSPDYVSGIEKLSRQLLLSLAQLHELRKFVFNYMKYFHANGEYLSDLAGKTYPIDSSFRTSRGPKMSRNVSGIRSASGLNVPSEENLGFDMDYVFHQFIERTHQDLLLHQRAASDIDQFVLEKITGFLKHHEPQVNTQLADLEELFDEYTSCYNTVETAKLQYTSLARLGEFLAPKEPESEGKSTDISSQIPIPTKQTIDPSMEEYGILFPLVIAGISLFNESAAFSNFLAALIETISVTRRKIPLPGYRNEIFSSEQLCEAIKRQRMRGFNPTRSNMEKLGQTLLDSRILVGTGFFAKKFNSEGMWFEWSDLAFTLAGIKHENSSIKPLTSQKDHTLLSLPKLDETWSSMTSTTTKRFNGVFKSMQNSLSKSRFSEEDLEESEEKYNEAYGVLQKQKHLLEMCILNTCQSMEQFEKLKIELVYQSLTKLLQILQATNSSFSKEFDSFCTMFVSKLNTPQNYFLEFDQGLANFSTGIYFPSLLAPDHPTNRHVNTSQLNTNFQNIRLGFNLFKDIPLQAKLGDILPERALSLHSVPIFLFETIKITHRFSKLELCLAWKQPINYQKYWLMKDELINKLQNFESDGTEIAVIQATESDLLKMCVDFVADKDVSRLVNFIKNWLLEISDSIIPSTVHDSLITNYKITRAGADGDHQRLAETLKILGAMPRSNLSSLIYILEHIAQTFELDILENFATSDEIKVGPPQTSEESLCELAAELNSLDTIAAIPFLHLIMRPSIVKNATGYRPPLEQYNCLLKDLLDVDTRHKLFDALVASEQQFIKRQEQQKQNLGIHKRQEPRQRSASTNSSQKSSIPQIEIGETSEGSHCEQSQHEGIPASPNPSKNENFELRPFRTGATPRPSPSASPVASKPKVKDLKLVLSTSFAPIRLDLEKE